MAGDFTIAVELQGLDELRKKLKSSTAATPCRRFLTRVGDDVIEQAKPLTPWNTGTLRRSIDKEVSTQTPVPTWVKIGTRVEYAPFVEFGRGPGKMPPDEPIRYWIRRKGKLGKSTTVTRQTTDGDVTMTLDAAVFALRRKIGRFGTQKQPYLAPGFKAAVPNIQKRVYTLATEIEEAYKRGS